METFSDEVIYHNAKYCSTSTALSFVFLAKDQNQEGVWPAAWCITVEMENVSGWRAFISKSSHLKDKNKKIHLVKKGNYQLQKCKMHIIMVSSDTNI